MMKVPCGTDDTVSNRKGAECVLSSLKKNAQVNMERSDLCLCWLIILNAASLAHWPS